MGGSVEPLTRRRHVQSRGIVTRGNTMNIAKQIEQIHTSVAQEIAALSHYEQRYTAALTRFDNQILPAIDLALTDSGLALKTLAVCKTGTITKIWQDGDKLRVEIAAVPCSGAFRFIAFAGYKASGSGRNEDALMAKATKIANNFARHELVAEVNPYSLEADRKGGENRVLITLWV